MRNPLSAPRKPEHAFGDDVAEHLGGPGLDRVAATPQLLVLPVAAPNALGPVQLRTRPEYLERELRQALIRLRPMELGDASLWAGDAGLHQSRQGAVVREAKALQLDPELRQTVA